MDEPWNHGIESGTDYAGSQPDGLCRHIVFHEQLGPEINGLIVSEADESNWRHWLPSIFLLIPDPEIPAGCGYFFDTDGRNVAFFINCDVAERDIQIP